jgi:adenosylcobinamide kinase / adenosylcobinamide-phosphate guanylyltransferase
LNAHTLILGGARSGKSLFGEKLALHYSTRPAYIATAQGGDEEMERRIAVHRKRRGNAFTNVEEPLNLAGSIAKLVDSHEVILVDCLTLWLSNLMFEEDGSATLNIADLLSTLKQTTTSKIILVSNEVGQGIVPDNALARDFRDSAGLLHQQVAAICAEVYFVTAGLPLALKGDLPKFF